MKFGKLTLESDKFLCVREKKGFAIVDLKNGRVRRRKINKKYVQGCLINDKKILALYSGVCSRYHLLET